VKNKIIITVGISIIVITAAAILYLMQNSHNNNLVNAKIINPVYEIDQYSDSSFVDGKISAVVFHKDRYYVCETSTKRIVVLDSTFNYLHSIGASGQGPGEFLTPGCFEIYHDSIFVVDKSKSNIQVFTLDGKFKRELKLPMIPPENYKFAIKESGNIIMSLFKDDYAIHEIKEGKILRSFGEYIQKKSARETFLNGQRHIGIIGNNIFAVHEANPFIDLYNSDGDLLNTLNLEDLSIIRELTIYRKNNPVSFNPKSILVSVYFQNICSYNNKIYILFNKVISKQNHSVNVIVIKLNDDKLVLEDVITLNDKENTSLRWGMSLCKTERNLLVSDGDENKIFIYNY